jgi:hypothetical protein
MHRNQSRQKRRSALLFSPSPVVFIPTSPAASDLVRSPFLIVVASISLSLFFLSLSPSLSISLSLSLIGRDGDISGLFVFNVPSREKERRKTLAEEEDERKGEDRGCYGLGQYISRWRSIVIIIVFVDVDPV